MDLQRKDDVVVTDRSTMRAIVQDTYGDVDVLREARIPVPTIGAGEVLVRVRAAGVDRGAWHLMAGLPLPVRLAGYGVRAPKNPVRGREVAGRIEAVGPGVGLAVGTEVCGVAEGAFAELTRARADLLVPVPERLTAVQAAALPISGLTALQAVRDHGSVEAGQTVLVIGASGGVGSFVVQMAKALGAVVTGTCRTEKIDFVRALGADHVLDHTREDIGTRRYDVVVDSGGNRPLHRLRRHLTPRGRLVIVGAETRGRWLGGNDRQLRALAWSPFLRQALVPFVSSENGADLATLAAMAAAGTITPAVDRTFPLAETAAALRALTSGVVRGKVVVTVP